MKQYSKKLISTGILFLALTILPNLTHAQDPGDPGPDPDAPIDGGISILVVAGVGYGLKKAKDYRKRQSSIGMTDTEQHI